MTLMMGGVLTLLHSEALYTAQRCIGSRLSVLLGVLLVELSLGTAVQRPSLSLPQDFVPSVRVQRCCVAA